MKIFIASDHAGFGFKEQLAECLKKSGHTVEDVGPFELNPKDDYPDFCILLAQKVAATPGSFGVVVGKSGVGEAIACNRVKGARAVMYWGSNTQLLALSREHNNANIISFGSDFVDPDEAMSVFEGWIATPFSGEERHVRRIKKLDA